MSGIIKRSLSIAGHRTSISLEEPFWRLLQAQAQSDGLSIPALVERIDSARQGTNLSSAIRVHLLTTLIERGGAALNDSQE
ncbi:MAG: ribbon-helix-helix domain-containing protein [Rhizobiales bacterium]|nr:ribbon-helix-helix domain-containing protein [Hyphomicrobiales bacterium]